jgi:hypothetical protein
MAVPFGDPLVNHRLGNRLFFIGYVDECRLEGEREDFSIEKDCCVVRD